MALPFRLSMILLVGLFLGGLLNLAIYRLAWHRRAVSPWSAPPPGAPPRRWSDRLPVIGWLGLRREAPLHGTAFWVRPLLLEMAVGCALPALYWWEVSARGLIADQLTFWLPPFAADRVVVPMAVLHAAFFSHAILLALMMVASIIDLDEQMIPDAVTLPGTAAGLILAVVLPWSLLPQIDLLPKVSSLGTILAWQGGGPATVPPAGVLCLRFLTLTAPNGWPAALAGAPRAGGLALGLACFWLWCFAMAPRPWYGRHGWRRAWQILAARLARAARRPAMVLIILPGTAAVVAVWLTGGARWAALLTALTGLAAGGGVIWSVRLIGAAALKKEAMGFGDVMLMMMIGSFLGWQPCLIVFFLAPFAGLVIALGQWVRKGNHIIPYGPFLCLASAATVTLWARVWNLAGPVFSLGFLVPAVMLVCLGAIWVMLALWRLLLLTLCKRP